MRRLRVASRAAIRRKLLTSGQLPCSIAESEGVFEGRVGSCCEGQVDMGTDWWERVLKDRVGVFKEC